VSEKKGASDAADNVARVTVVRKGPQMPGSHGRRRGGVVTRPKLGPVAARASALVIQI
jgi:hypothetical protein